MTLLWMDGFEFSTMNSTFYGNGASSQISTTTPRTGTYNIRISDGSTSRGFNRVVNDTSIILVGFAFRISIGQTTDKGLTTLQASPGGTIQCAIYAENVVGNIYKISVIKGNTGPNIAESTETFRNNSWHYLEYKIFINDTTGYVIVHLDGNEIINETGLDTKNASIETTNSVHWGAVNGFIGTDETYFDDLYVCNTSGTENTGFLGPIRVDTLYPDGTGTINDWIGSDGNSVDNHLLVDDTSLLTSTYVEASGLEDTDLYQIDNISYATSNIKGIFVNNYSQKEGVNPGTGTNVIEISGVLYTGFFFPESLDPLAPTTGYLPSEGAWNVVINSFELDPSTGSAWANSTINDLQIGNKIIGF